jgi:hypothetical protein
VYSNERKELFGEILKNTYHVIFLDTPHMGIDTSTWKAVYGSLATPQAQEQFGLWSTVLAKLGRTFIDIGNRLHISSGYASLSSETSKGNFKVSSSHFILTKHFMTPIIFMLFKRHLLRLTILWKQFSISKMCRT